MQIGASAASRLFERQATTRETSPSPAAGASDSVAVDSVELSSAARAVLAAAGKRAEGNFEHMTPSEMKGVAEDLWRAGTIDITQLHMLQTAGIPLGKVGPNGELVPLTDQERANYESTPVDYVGVAKGAMRHLEQMHLDADPKSGYQAWQGILATLQS
ncbi:MAG: hypothetical protein ACOZD0_05615 [Pseudomonadota bacterium]